MIKIHNGFIALLLSSFIGLQAWVLLETVKTRENLAVLSAKVQMHVEMTGAVTPQPRNKI